MARYTLRAGDLERILPANVLEASAAHVAATPYRCLIGVECEGFIWAGAMAERYPVPYVHFSLELYTRDAPNVPGRRFRRLKRLERHYHRRCHATIIQDRERSAALFDDVGRVSPTVHYVPVSLLGPSRTEKSDYLHRLLGLPAGTKVVLYFGALHALPYPEDLVGAARDLPDDWILVVHGPAYGDRALLDRLHRANAGGRARINTELVHGRAVDDLIASADIGLVPYVDRTENERLTGRSSEKAARYAQAGVPMIAFDRSSFREVFESYRCGRCLSTFRELPASVIEIQEDYARYRAEAFRAYDEVYEFSRHFRGVVDWIDALPPAAPSRRDGAPVLSRETAARRR
jgi:glycosyltransferase involved in cell wall biosynthesis